MSRFGQLTDRVRVALGGMTAADRAQWAQARTLADIGETDRPMDGGPRRRAAVLPGAVRRG
jgi:hypothetical protein